MDSKGNNEHAGAGDVTFESRLVPPADAQVLGYNSSEKPTHAFLWKLWNKTHR